MRREDGTRRSGSRHGSDVRHPSTATPGERRIEREYHARYAGSVRRLLVVAATVALASASPVAAVEMSAELQPDTIFLGAQALLVVHVDDPIDNTWPTVAPVPGLKIQRYGSPGMVQDLFQGTTTYRYRFLITPEKPGVFTIASVTLKAGPQTLTQGPLALRVLEAPVAFRGARIEPAEVLVGDTARLVVIYQGIQPGQKPVIPPVDGLTIRPSGEPRTEVDRATGIPLTQYTYTVTALRLGKYAISGITFAGVPVTEKLELTVSSHVVVGTQADESSLVVNRSTFVHVVVRGVSQNTAVRLVTPVGVKWRSVPPRVTAPTGAAAFSFEVTPTQPGDFTIREIELPDGQKVPLRGEPIVISVRQGGDVGILVCRGIPRSEQTVVGEPFIVDYEVFFRGNLRGMAVDTAQAAFANKEYVRVEPVDNPSYAGWQGVPYQVRFGEGRMTVLSGSGELNGQKEQMLRFALRVTPLAAGELPLDGLRVILAIEVREERRTGFSVFSSVRQQQYDRVADTPAHRVVDPPGVTPPPLYRGAVGESFTFTTSLDRTSATAMSPLTLTMKITGETVSARFSPPPLTEVPELTRDFDVSSTVGGGEVKDRTITFTQVIRPRSEAVKELPALPLVYYDYKAKKYQTVHSLPIPIQVSAGRLAGAGAMQVAAVPQVVASAPAPAAEAGRQALLGANFADLGPIAAGPPLSIRAVGALLAGGPACIAAVWAGRVLYRRRRPRAEARRRRGALVASLAQVEAAEDFFPRLAEVIQEYLRLVFDLPPGELSRDAMARAFERARLGETLRRDADEILAACDAGRFAGGGVGAEEKARLVEQARRLFAALEARA